MCQMMTDFQKYFADKHSSKFVVRWGWLKESADVDGSDTDGVSK